MGKLIYAANVSLDGFLEDETGSFDWSVPDEDVHAFWNDHERHIGTSLYGRRMYETMRVWERDDWLTTAPAVVREYAGIWRDADKVVYSTSLDAVATARTLIESPFEPDAVRRLKEASSSDLSIGGAAIGPKCSGKGWSTSACSSCTRCSWAGASRRCPTAFDSISSCWTMDGSAMAWSTRAT